MMGTPVLVYRKHGSYNCGHRSKYSIEIEKNLCYSEIQEGIMRIAICDDRTEELEEIAGKLNAVFVKFHEELNVVCYSDGKSLVQDLERGAEYELLILDIYMDEMDGIETARKAHACLPDVSVAFLTSSPDFAVEAFALKAVHYLLKPVKEAELEELIQRARTFTDEKKQILTLQKGDKKFYFLKESVIKILSSKRGVDIYYDGKDSPVWVPITFSEAERQLKGLDFLKISRGFLVAMGEIEDISKNGSCEFKDGTTALISRKEKEQTRIQYHEYLFRCLERGHRNRV